MNTISPYALSYQPQMALSKSLYSASPSSIHSKAMRPAFGSCFCPICASMTILVEANDRVKKLQAGDVIDPQATLKAISSKTGFNYVPHARATRLALPAKTDIDAQEKAALDMEFTQNGLKLAVPPENSLYSVVYESLSKALLHSQLSQNSANYKLLSILHHMQNADEKLTKPTSMGYVLLSKNSEPEELFIPSLRALPTYQGLNVVPAGLSNIVTGAVTSPHPYKSVAVAVETHQTDMKQYLDYLNKMGLTVKRYADIPKGVVPNGFGVTQIPQNYLKQVNQLYPMLKPNLYKIDISPLSNWLAKGIPAAIQDIIAKQNPEAKPFLAKPLTEEALITILQPPAPPGARKSIPRE